MDNFLKQLKSACLRIEKDWQALSYDSEAFYSVIEKHAPNLDIAQFSEFSAQLNFLGTLAARSIQKATSFSDLNITLFDNTKFSVEIYNWFDSHVKPHEHDFTGVLYQIRGRSLNVLYEFKSEQSAGAIEQGKLIVKDAEILQEGALSDQRHGCKRPHGVYHLDSPSVTLLFRTKPMVRFGAPRNYFPTVAARAFVYDNLQRKTVSALRILAEENSIEFVDSFKFCINRQSQSENFFMFLGLMPTIIKCHAESVLVNYAARGKIENAAVGSAMLQYFIQKGWNNMKGRTEMPVDERLLLLSACAGFNKANALVIVNKLMAKGHVASVHSFDFAAIAESKTHDWVRPLLN